MTAEVKAVDAVKRSSVVSVWAVELFVSIEAVLGMTPGRGWVSIFSAGGEQRVYGVDLDRP